MLEFVIIASIDSHRGPICFTSLTEHLPSLASAWSRYVCTVGGCLATALTASAFVLSRRLLGLRQFSATPMPTWECLGITWHLLVACQVYVFASSAFSGGDVSFGVAEVHGLIFPWCFRIRMPQMSAVRLQYALEKLL